MPTFRIPARAYLAICLLVCAAPLLGVLSSFFTPAAAQVPYAQELLWAGAGNLLASLLTYPAGAIGSAVSALAVFSGWLTPAEALLVSAPVYALAGHWQWYVWLPRRFRRSRAA